MDEKQLEINFDGNEQLEIDLSENKKIDNTNCSKFKAHKVYVDNAKKRAEKEIGR